MLHPDNALAYGIYQRCRGQLIFAGMSGQAVDINILAVMGLMDRMGIPLDEQDGLLEQVQILAWTILSTQSEKRRAEEAQKKASEGR